MSQPPLVVHVIWRLAAGGMENGLVNLINHLPRELCRHAVVALDDITDFAKRITREDVRVVALEKPLGHGISCYPALRRLLRQWQPAMVHTRGLAALEMAPLARWMGIPVIHGEHGWDASDPNGLRKKYQLLRRLYRPFVTHYIAVSQSIEDYLVERIGVGKNEVSQICNGVDLAQFGRGGERREAIPGSPFNADSWQVIGAVMRMARVKDPLGLVAAFGHAVRALPTLRLVMVGEGELTENVRAAVASAGLKHKVWLAGERSDVADLMRGFDAFVLPSRAEGMSNTLLEAMASGLPVIATDVGGNRELVVPGQTGVLVPPADAGRLAQAMVGVLQNATTAREMGRRGRERVEQNFSLETMVDAYAALYARMLQRSGALRGAA